MDSLTLIVALFGLLYGYKEHNSRLTEILKKAIPTAITFSIIMSLLAIMLVSVLQIPLAYILTESILLNFLLTAVIYFAAFMVGTPIGNFLGDLKVRYIYLISLFMMLLGTFLVTNSAMYSVALTIVSLTLFHLIQTPSLQRIEFYNILNKQFLVAVLAVFSISMLLMYIGNFGMFAAVTTCFDTDGGNDIFERGTVFYELNTYTDYCESREAIHEYSCEEGQGGVKESTIYCQVQGGSGSVCEGYGSLFGSEQGRCTGKDREDIRIMSMSVDKTQITADDVEETVTITLRNQNPIMKARRPVEVCVYPKSWAGDVYPALNQGVALSVFFREYYWAGCCKENYFCDSIVIDLEPSEEISITFRPEIPLQGEYDACHGLGSAYDPSGYNVVAAVIKSCFSPAIEGSGGFIDYKIQPNLPHLKPHSLDSSNLRSINLLLGQVFIAI